MGWMQAGRAGALIGILAVSTHAATIAELNNANLSGKYFFRELQVSTDTSGNITDTRASLGTIQFDGAGHYSLTGSLTQGANAAVNLGVNGSYTVNTPGTMTLTDPQRTNLLMNGRLAGEAIVGSTTESGDNTFNLFVAIPAPTSTPSGLSGSYYCSTLEFPGGGTSVRSALFTLPINTGNSFGSVDVFGHLSSVNNGNLATQVITGTYALANDGSGTAAFTGTSNNLNGTKNIYLSQTGNMILGGSIIAGTQDFMVCAKAFSGTPQSTTWSGLYWTAGLRYDTNKVTTEAYAGSLNALASLSAITFSDRLHQVGIATGIDFTGSNAVSINSDNTYASLFNIVGMGTNGGLFVDADLSQFDINGYSIDVGVLAPQLSGTGVYIDPQGGVNAASLAPIGASVSPGEFVTIFGSGLGGQATTATAPYPTTLNNTSVTVNGISAPVYYASATQLNILIPYAVTGSSATIQVTYNGTASNQVVVPLAATSPGIFSTDNSGRGPGAIEHADGTIVNTSNPAKKGETVVIFLTGLGAVATAVNDGTAATGPDNANAAVTVYIGGLPGKIVYAGLAPGFPGLYQINVTVSTALTGSGALPVAVQTANAFHDQVTVQVQ